MKDAKGHGSNGRGGSDYAPSASGKPGYNPKVQGGMRMFGRQPTKAEAAANSANVKSFAAFAGGMNKVGVAESRSEPRVQANLATTNGPAQVPVVRDRTPVARMEDNPAYHGGSPAVTVAAQHSIDTSHLEGDSSLGGHGADWGNWQGK